MTASRELFVKTIREMRMKPEAKKSINPQSSCFTASQKCFGRMAVLMVDGSRGSS
jgi:hypothetical protein